MIHIACTCIISVVVKPENVTKWSVREMERLEFIQRSWIENHYLVSSHCWKYMILQKFKAGCIYYLYKLYAISNHRSQPTSRAELLVGCLNRTSVLSSVVGPVFLQRRFLCHDTIMFFFSHCDSMIEIAFMMSQCCFVCICMETNV